MQNKKFRVVIDFDFKSKKKFEFEFKFVNVRNPGYEINAMELIEYLKEVVSAVESGHLGKENSFVKDDEFYH